MTSSVVVEAARTETKTLSRLQSIEIEKSPLGFEPETRRAVCVKEKPQHNRINDHFFFFSISSCFNGKVTIFFWLF